MHTLTVLTIWVKHLSFGSGNLLSLVTSAVHLMQRKETVSAAAAGGCDVGLRTEELPLAY